MLSWLGGFQVIIRKACMTVDQSECVSSLDCVTFLVQMYIKDHYSIFWKICILKTTIVYFVAATEGHFTKLSTFFQLQSEVIALVFQLQSEVIALVFQLQSEVIALVFQLQSEVIALVFPFLPYFRVIFTNIFNIVKLVLILNMHEIYILLNID